MIPSMAFAGIEPPAASEQQPARRHPADMPLIDQLSKGWSSVALGIILAGGVYPVVLAGVGSLLLLVFESPNVAEFLVGAAVIVIYSVITALAGLVWTNVVVVVTLPFVLLIVWSLRVRGGIVWLGAFWGGLVGFVAVLPFMFIGGIGNELVTALAFGPALTTVIGQLGGAWGGRRALRRIDWYERAVARATVKERLTGVSRHEAEPVADEPPQRQARFQFRIRHLMWTAVWLSVFLSLIRLLGIPFELAMPVLGGWFVYQAGTLCLGWLLMPWLSRRLPAAKKTTTVGVPRGTTSTDNAASAFHVEHAVGQSVPDDVTREVVSRETSGGRGIGAGD
jgi:hypothetical protein